MEQWSNGAVSNAFPGEQGGLLSVISVDRQLVQLLLLLTCVMSCLTRGGCSCCGFAISYSSMAIIKKDHFVGISKLRS